MYMNITENEDIKCNDNYFISVKDVEETFRNELGEVFNPDLFTLLINKFIFSVIEHREEFYLYTEDIELFKKLMILNNKIDLQDINDIVHTGSLVNKKIWIEENTYLLYDICDIKKEVPVYVRNIVKFSWEKDDMSSEWLHVELLGTTIATTNKKIASYVESAVYRKRQLDILKSSSFTGSSSYMGTKRKLLGFIVESMFPYCQDNVKFLDIMCGSGSVSNGLAQMGKVYASDAQDFCRLLAKIQGSGFYKTRARILLRQIYDDYNNNLSLLQLKFRSELSQEDEIFHMNIAEKEKVLEAYEKFIESFQLYTSTEVCSYEIAMQVNERKREHTKVPFCLFTYYFTNVYFGLAQCIQLDSIRYAISKIENKEEQEWALGVLVVVTSIIASTYGGHFAQPKKLDIKSLEYIISQREKSAWLEFSKRMLAMSEESEKYSYRVELLEGPWEKALNTFRTIKSNCSVVYFDAPYKRDEYSRYYHVLETMVKYDYPASEYKGRMRSKKNGERFVTEFFSKNELKMQAAYEKVILSILNIGAVCVWSYSNNGVVSIIDVLTNIKKSINCNIYIYGTKYVHLSQGKSAISGKSRKNVIEYCIIFIRK